MLQGLRTAGMALSEETDLRLAGWRLSFSDNAANADSFVVNGLHVMEFTGTFK